MPLTAGQALAHYDLVAPLGAGGMGEVWRARDTKLGREVALKVLPVELAEHPEALARFRREARVLAELDHPNIVPIYSVEDADGTTFLTMGLVEGETLAASIPEGGHALAGFLELARPLLGGVAAAHERGIVHRDLKPENVMLGRDARLRLLDFGLARHDAPEASEGPDTTEGFLATEAGRVLGTAPYMSPEQATGRPVDPRSDVFSLGALLYELASGRRAFSGRTPTDVLAAVLRDAPAPLGDVAPHLPATVAAVIERCLAKAPERRFATAGDVLVALEDALLVTGPPRARQRLVHLLVVLALAVAAWGTRGFWSAEQAADPFDMPAVAVLPVLGAGAEGGGVVAFGLAEEVYVELQRRRLLPVISRGATLAMDVADRAPARAAEVLGAGFVLTTTVLREEPQLGLLLELTDGVGAVVWNDTIELGSGAGAALDASGEVAAHVLSQILGREVERVEREDHPPSGAWEHYLRGLAFLDAWHDEGYEEAHQHALAAIDAASDFASAWWLLGELEVTRLLTVPWDPLTGPAELQGIIARFQHAHDLSPFHASACGCLGYLLLATGKEARAQAVFEEALAVNPMSLDLLVDYGPFLLHREEYGLVHEVMAKALRLDPVSADRAIIFMVRSIAHYAQGDDPAARADIERSVLAALNLWISPAGVPLAYALDGREAAREALDELRVATREPDLENPVVRVVLDPLDRILARRPGRSPGGVEEAFATLEEPEAPPVLAVLPLRDLGGDAWDEAGDDAFLGGLQEDLVTRLSSVDGLAVVSTMVTEGFRDTPLALPEVARALGADALLIGSLRRSGSRVRLTAQLADGATGRNLWGEAFDEDIALTDVFDVQTQLVAHVVEELMGELTPGAGVELRASPTRDPQALALYVRGRDSWVALSQPRLDRALDYFSEALERDPDFALAQAAVADAYLGMEFIGEMPLEEAVAKSRAAVDAALAIDPDLPEARGALGHVLLHELDGPGAERELRAALEQRPSYLEAHLLLGMALLDWGRLPEAEVQTAAALRVDPLSLFGAWGDGLVALARGEDEAAVERFERALEVDGTWVGHYELGWALAATGDQSGARDAFERAATLGSGALAEELGLASTAAAFQALAGDPVGAEARLAALDVERESPFALGLAHAALGRLDRAFDLWLGATEWTILQPAHFRYGALPPGVREDPRYVEVLVRIDERWGW